MNERIQKLAEQATKWSTAMNWSHDPKYGDRRQDELFLEKFAQLIVQGVLDICYDVARPQYNGDDHKFTPGAKAVEKLVKEFYGVVE